MLNIMKTNTVTSIGECEDVLYCTVLCMCVKGLVNQLKNIYKRLSSTVNEAHPKCVSCLYCCLFSAGPSLTQSRMATN